MSAVNILVQEQKGIVSMISDGAAYMDGTADLVACVKKICAIGNHSAISSIGPSLLSEEVADSLTESCDNFDDVLAIAESRIEDVYAARLDRLREDDDGIGEMMLTGYSKRRARPEAYTLRIVRPGKTEYWGKMQAGSNRSSEPFKLAQVLNKFVVTPTPGKEIIAKSRFRIPTLADVETLDAQETLLHLLEVQRHWPCESPRWLGKHLVGVQAQLVTISANGIDRDEIVRTWPDEIGKPITPGKIDWNAYLAKRLEGVVNVDGLSRLQRERMLKKAKKGTLRAIR
jgi:hypothetical protein